MKKSTLSVVLAVSILALTSCGTSFDASRAMYGGMKALSAASISNQQVQSYVNQYIADLDSKSTVLPDNSPYVTRLKKLTSGLNSVEGIPLNFKVYKTSDVNAFACADGSVRVYSGLMDLMSDEEVLGVIGHEVGHVALKHSQKQFKQALLTSALMDAVASTGSVAAALTDSQLGAIGESLAGAQFSQKQESQADDYGYDFLKGAGKNPWAMAMAFEKLQSLSGGSATAGQAASGSSSNSSVSQLFSSHPATATRIEKISKRASADGFKRPASK